MSNKTEMNRAFGMGEIWDEMVLHPVSLSFRDGNEKKFLQKYYTDSLFLFRISFTLVTLLYAGFHFLDKLVAPQFQTYFLWIRFGVVVPFLLGVLAMSFFKVFEKCWQFLLFSSMLISGIGIALMLMKVSENRVYYGGMMLIFMAGYFFIKLRFYLATIAGWLILIFYNVGAIWFSQTDPLALVSNNFFFVSANLIGMFAAYSIEYYTRKEYFQSQQILIRQREVVDINRNLEQKVAQRTRQLSEAKERTEQSDRLKSAFLANMSHEIRTPMHSILGFSQLLPECESKEELQQYVDIINKNGNHLLSIINDIIDISKIEAGMLSLTPTSFSISQLMDEVIELFSREERILSRALALKKTCPLQPGADCILADRLRLKQVLINLVGNSCKYTQKGYVDIGYRIEGTLLVFYVADTGIGLSKELQQVVFERFMQATTGHVPKHSGTGLGLAISKAIVKLFGGEIWVDSSEGQGATFSFSMPLYQQGKSILCPNQNPD